jgi:hypothetical protein
VRKRVLLMVAVSVKYDQEDGLCVAGRRLFIYDVVVESNEVIANCYVLCTIP